MAEPDPVALHPMQRVIAVAVAEERRMLEAFLDDYRNAVTRKVRGASEEDIRRRLVPSATTLGGIVTHLRWVELYWFQRILAQTPDSELSAIPWDDPNATFRVAPEDTVEGLIADYDRQCELSRQVAAQHKLSDTTPHPELREVSLRWIYVHMIEETARHAGHADILREQIDGKAGR
jgi:uncharacterized protein DUF664